MRSSIKLFFIVFFFSTTLSAQSKDEQLIKNEDELVALYNQLILCQDNNTRDSINQLFYDLLVSSLNTEGSYTYPFDNLPTISKMQSDDKRLRIFTYNIQNNEGLHFFYGIVQLNPKYTKAKSEKAILLYNQKGELSKHEMKSFGPDKWPGAVYYEMVSFKKGRNKYYTLAGWRGVDNGLTQKMIDVIYISGDDVKFGYPIFKMDKKVQRRIVFSYNAKATMHLGYDEKQGQFIFNHLAPSSNLVADQYRFYGPDGSYDALVMEKKNWLYVPNVDAKNQEKASDLFYTPVSKPNID